jgi:hypothetical protein
MNFHNFTQCTFLLFWRGENYKKVFFLCEKRKKIYKHVKIGKTLAYYVYSTFL